MIRRRATVEPIFGVQLIDLDVFRDGRGELVALEERSNLPFPPRRVLYLKVDNPSVARANFATSSDLFIAPVVGSAIIDVDNGEERASLALDVPDLGIWARPGIHIRFRDFANPTVLLVCASQHAVDTRHFQTPRPGLIHAPALT